MDNRSRPPVARLVVALCAAVLLLFGLLVARGGFRVIGRWREIGAAYAAIAIVWAIAGPVMMTAALGIIASGGRHRVPLWAGSACAVIAGLTLILGVLTFVVPCAGPT